MGEVHLNDVRMDAKNVAEELVALQVRYEARGLDGVHEDAEHLGLLQVLRLRLSVRHVQGVERPHGAGLEQAKGRS